MSRVFKASNVTVDENNHVFIDVSHNFEDIIYEEDGAEKEIIPRDPEAEAKTIIEIAEAEAKRILNEADLRFGEIVESAIAEANDKAKLVRFDAREEGFQEGYRQGMEEAQLIIEKAEQIKEEAEEIRESRIAEIEPDMVQLVAEIAEKILTDEVEINPDVILILIKKGLAHASLTGDVNVHISDEDLDYVLSYRSDILKNLETMAKINFLEDVTLKKGECIIETNFGNIDCGLDSQFKLLKKHLFYLLKNR